MKIGILNPISFNQLELTQLGMIAGTAKSEFLCVEKNKVLYLLDGTHRFLLNYALYRPIVLIKIDYNNLKGKRIVNDINTNNIHCVYDKYDQNLLVKDMISIEKIGTKKQEILFDSAIMHKAKEYADGVIKSNHKVLNLHKRKIEVCDYDIAKQAIREEITREWDDIKELIEDFK